METRQVATQPKPPALWIHLTGRILVVSFYTCIGLGAVSLIAGVIVSGAFTSAPAGVPTFHYTMPARIFIVTGISLFASIGLILAIWGLLQALYPAMFVPTMKRFFDPFKGQWFETLAARSSSTTVQSVFQVGRRIRFWGLCTIPFGLGLCAGMLVLAYTFNQSMFPQIDPFSPPMLINDAMLMLVPVFVSLAARDSCWNRRVSDQLLAEHQREGEHAGHQ